MYDNYLKAVIVDDDKLVRLGLINSLPWHECNMKVVADFQNGTSALKYLQENTVDIVFIDVEMPGMNGIKLLEKIKQIDKNTHCVMLTMHQEFEYVQTALRLGVLDYIIKLELNEMNLKEILMGIYNRIGKSNILPDMSEQEYSKDICNCISQAVQIINETHSNGITSHEISKKVNMSRSYFSTCFKQIMGVSYYDYVKKTCMQYAKQQLETTELSIGYIACDVGFDNEKYFATVYKSYYGISPSELRRSNKKKGLRKN